MDPQKQLFEFKLKQQFVNGLSKSIKIDGDSSVYVQYQGKRQNDSPIKLNVWANDKIVKSEVIDDMSEQWESNSILTSFNLVQSEDEYVIRVSVQQEINS